MILKASQRGSGGALAVHLLNGHDNEHVEVHAVKGFVAETLAGAMQEAHALSRGTHCQQYLFSVSLSPPKNESVPVAVFEDAIDRIARKLGLEHQPHVIVFHEKEGRRHAHCVWSRIDTKDMKAVNLPFFKNRLMGIAKELYLEHGWTLPQGFIDRNQRNPLNFSLEEWQQAKRLNDNPQAIKLALKECWAVSDNGNSFAAALERQGFYPARGDRRGYVAVDWRGEVYSLSKWLDVKTRDLRAKLGEAECLPSVDNTRARLDKNLAERIRAFAADIDKSYAPRFSPLKTRRASMRERHDAERQHLADRQQKRQQQEARERQARLHTGLRGLWDRMTGRHARSRKQNEINAYRAHVRDREEKDALIYRQLEQRRVLQDDFDRLRTDRDRDMDTLKEGAFARMPEEQIERLRATLEQAKQQPMRGFDLEM